jgi:hypothetical protein
MCHHRHHHRRVEAIRDEPLPLPRDREIRASDGERESAVVALREHGAQGRLDVDELEQRVGAAYAARTRGELADLLADLPGAAAARARTGAQRHRPHDNSGGEWGSFLGLAAILIGIWALAGGGYFWPAWVLVWWLVPLALRTGPRLLRLR